MRDMGERKGKFQTTQSILDTTILTFAWQRIPSSNGNDANVYQDLKNTIW
jgi:hypothetical protein